MRSLALVVPAMLPLLIGGCLPPSPLDPGGADGAGVEIQTVVAGAAFPTAIAIAPDGRLFYTEKTTGKVRVITAWGELLAQPFATVPVVSSGERGLLGIAVHPEFDDNGLVYVYYTRAAGGTTAENRVVRFTAGGDIATGPEQLIFEVEAEAGAIHNGGHLDFDPAGRLYISLGDHGTTANAQDPAVRPGKIIRINDDGSIPADNPFGANNAAFALGIRNSFGIAIDPVSGLPFTTENGTSRHDEVNRIVGGGNYGWPEVLGLAGDPRFIDPLVDFGEGSVVPTGIDIAPSATFGNASQNQLFVGQYGTGRILRYTLNAARDAVESEFIFAQGISGGITDLQFAPDGTLYVSTSTDILHIVPAGD